MALALIVLAFGVRWAWAPIALFVFVILPLAVIGKIGREVLRTSIVVTLPLAISLGLVQGLFFPGAETSILSIGTLSLKAEGLQFAFVTATRLLVIAGAVLLIMFATHPADLALALVQRGAPPALAYVAVTAIQLLPEMRARAERILNAQAARGLETEGNLRVRLRALVPLLGPLVYGALESVQERALALEARAFQARRPKTSWRELRDSRRQSLLRLALVIATPSLIVLSFL